MTHGTNLWRTLIYHDPAAILRRLREVEREIAQVEMDDRVRRLRTTELKQYREWRDAAVFAYGMGLILGTQVSYATVEASDYDFVTTWVAGDTRHYCPVQLKELPPADLNPSISLEEILLRSVKDARPTDTVLAVKLNRAGRLDFGSVTLPPLPWRQVWFFWASAPDASQWSLFGDVLGEPGRFDFAYPR